MSAFTVERYHDISCGHRVAGHENKCAHLHGHNYRITFTLAAKPVPRNRSIDLEEAAQADTAGLDEIGRVIDFSVIKTRLCAWLEKVWDHKMLIWVSDPLANALTALVPDDIVLVPFNPTAENMAEYLVNVVAPDQLMGTGTVLIACRVEETRKCSATYIRSRT